MVGYFPGLDCLATSYKQYVNMSLNNYGYVPVVVFQSNLSYCSKSSLKVKWDCVWTLKQQTKKKHIFIFKFYAFYIALYYILELNMFLSFSQFFSRNLFSVVLSNLTLLKVSSHSIYILQDLIFHNKLHLNLLGTVRE